ncbi:tetratricopeptide repeat protein [Ureibacillus acetophenoni]|uniref:Tetratricopeptide repeat protein n=1 Tax=Ureibacillus acetophenoni TaxID=614649 RepID=A0A285UN56_9BACL|nr:tetratricopeptide repeat protein [Ureibacillus acetophenoni]SOC43252.1 tetratricopeptide repeat protein [Ureibacillus acetophenoni]
MKIGDIIKFKRIEQGISQEELAQGICTNSYLSRIENNHVTPDEEIYRLLLGKLGADYDEVIYSSIEMEKDLDDWYAHLTKKTPLKKELSHYLNLESQLNQGLVIKYKIIYSRYLLTIEKYNQAKEILDDVYQVLPSLNNYEKFIFINTYVVCFTILNKNEDAIQIFEEYTQDHNINYGTKEEHGNLYYNIALCYRRIRSYKACIDYAKRALNEYSDQYHLNRMVQTLVLLGIAYNNIYEWDKSIKYYKQALHIVEQLNIFSDYEKIMIYNDLGYCSECQNQYYDAIHYYQSSLKIEPNNFNILSNLARTYYKIGDFKEAKVYLNKANQVMESTKVNDSYIISNNLLNCLLFIDYKDMDEIFTTLNSNFPHIVKNRIYELIIFYSKEFGAILEKHKFYKKSNELYKYAFDAYANLLKGGEKNNV